MAGASEILTGFTERIEDAMGEGLKQNWSNAMDRFVSVLADIKESDIDSSPSGQRAKQALINCLEQHIDEVQKVLDIDASCDALADQSRPRTPEPPNDPEPWSRSVSQQPVGRAVNSKTKSQSTTNAGTSASEKGKKAAEKSKATAATAVPVSEEESLVPPNKDGERFNGAMYDPMILKSVLGTMTLSHDRSKSYTWDSICGMDDVKRLLQETVTLPTLCPEVFTGILRPWKAMFLAGGPGTGKTMMARVLASEANSTFFVLSASDFSSKWRGDSEKIVRLLFELARFYAPSIIFIDEFDSIGSERAAGNEHEASRRVKSEFLSQMDGFTEEEGKHVFVLAATNFPWAIDGAIRRRFEKRVYVPMPNKEARMKLIEKSMKGTMLSSDVKMDVLAERLEGYSGADVVSVCRSAAFARIRRLTEGKTMESVPELLNSNQHVPISMVDFESALGSVKSSVDPDFVTKCMEWCDSNGSL